MGDVGRQSRGRGDQRRRRPSGRPQDRAHGARQQVQSVGGGERRQQAGRGQGGGDRGRALQLGASRQHEDRGRRQDPDDHRHRVEPADHRAGRARAQRILVPHQPVRLGHDEGARHLSRRQEGVQVGGDHRRGHRLRPRRRRCLQGGGREGRRHRRVDRLPSAERAGLHHHPDAHPAAPARRHRHLPGGRRFDQLPAPGDAARREDSLHRPGRAGRPQPADHRGRRHGEVDQRLDLQRHDRRAAEQGLRREDQGQVQVRALPADLGRLRRHPHPGPGDHRRRTAPTVRR